ncbi:MAG: CoA transferase [Chloroflexi bacterium]|nr:CoA transferase [Chloroflexota bacterium]
MTMALAGLRVVDLAGPEGQLCGRLLADLGAEVIKVEPPAGDLSRHFGPFAGERPDPEASLPFVYFNANKKSVTLDWTLPADRERLERLLRTADAVVTTSPDGLAAAGLDEARLRAEHPGLVVAAISGFGSSGPYRDFKAPSIVCAAMGGVMYLCGAPDRPPLAEPGDQPYHLASAFAAGGVLLALRQRDRTGRGPRVEVSAQEAQASQQHIVVNYSANAAILRRSGGRSSTGGGMPYGVYPASDGYCHLVVILTSHWRSLVEWMGSPELFADAMWDNRHLRNANADLIEPPTAEFTRQLTKSELFAEGQRRHITVAPINRPDEFTRDPHARARELFLDVEHPVVGTCRLVRPPFRMSATPGGFTRPAPLLGEHNAEILGGLGPDETPALPSVAGSAPGAEGPAAPAARGTASASGAVSVPAGTGAAPSGSPRGDPSGPADSLPLAGIRVLDFSQAIAGPFLTRLLAENGAEVIKLESQAYQQRGRTRAGMDPRIILQQKVTFADVNRNKRSIAVDMSRPEARELVRRVVPHCDVVVENFSPRVLEKWGLGYEELRRLRGDVVMVRLPGFGTTGPYRDYLGLAAVAMGVTGLYHLWSYADRPEPAGPPVWMPDYLSAAFGLTAVTAALRHRDRTGEGQVVDLAQTEATAVVLGASYLDYFVNGRVGGPLGNRHPRYAPHGAYRCRGDDAWCAIAVRDDAEWAALARVMGEPAWTREPRFATAAERLANQDDLDPRLEEWTREHTPHQVMRLLQKAGVPAGAVQDGERLYHDPHLRERGFIAKIEDVADGPLEYPGVFVRLSEAPAPVGRCHDLGEDNDFVFGDLAGLPTAEIRRLEQDGILA